MEAQRGQNKEIISIIDNGRFNKKNIPLDILLKNQNFEEDPKSLLLNISLDNHLANLLRSSQGEDPDFARILGQFERRPTQNLPAQPATIEDRKNTFRSQYGLTVYTDMFIEMDVLVNGQAVLQKGNEYTSVDFMPGHRARLDRSRMTDSMDKGIKGLVELIAAIERGDVVLAPVFVGTTNLNMALISQRLGFRIADSCRKPDGTIDKGKDQFTVVGRLEDIKQKLTEFIQKGLDQKVAQRAVRTKPQLQPA